MLRDRPARNALAQRFIHSVCLLPRVYISDNNFAQRGCGVFHPHANDIELKYKRVIRFEAEKEGRGQGEAPPPAVTEVWATSHTDWEQIVKKIVTGAEVDFLIDPPPFISAFPWGRKDRTELQNKPS